MIDYIHNRDGRATSTRLVEWMILRGVFTPDFIFHH